MKERATREEESAEAGPTVAGRDDPEAYITHDRRMAIASGTRIPDRVTGSALFADISGFTPLSESLQQELGAQQGAEVLTANLDRIFHALINDLHRFGGNVIYFSGDAITAWVDGDDGSRAVSSALEMQDTIGREGTVTTPAGRRIELSLKVTVATGEVRRAVVGDPDIQLIDVLAGSLLDHLADAEGLANSGEVLIDETTLFSLGNRVKLRNQIINPKTQRTLGVVEELSIEVEEAPTPDPPPLDPEVVGEWLLPVVFERIRTGRGEFLAELRNAYPVFVRFTGLDFDGDDAAIQKLKDFVDRAQHIFADYGGNVLQLTLGDKGAYLYGVFGSPITHEDDAARASAAALELAQLVESTAAQDISIGISHGALRSGTYGHAKRRTFVCLGDPVNVAARLMSKAPPGNIYATADVARAAGDAFVWRQRNRVKLKGKKQRVEVAELTASLNNLSRRKTRFELPMYGREQELAVLSADLGEALGGLARIRGISAEAGLGKSRLVAEFVREARRQSVKVAFGECQSFGVNTSYFVWREIWRQLLEIDDGADIAQQRTQAEAVLQQIDPGLVARAPLLSEVLGITIPDNDLTGSFDAKLRKSSLEDLLVRCLTALTATEQLVIVLEDCHWIDSLSRDLLEALVRSTPDSKLLYLLAYRPAEQPGGGLGIENLDLFDETELEQLGYEETRLIVDSKCRQLFDLAEASTSLADLVISRSDGNPFYAEELLNFIAAQKIDPSDWNSLRRLELPDSLHNLILSRIDALSERPRRTLKVASVMGRIFQADVLPDIYPELGSLDDVLAELEVLKTQDLVSLDQPDSHAYLFKHVVTQEVSYNSMPFAFRSDLHRRYGEHIEANEPDLETQLDLLAHHYWHSDAEDKKRQYLTRAEETARRRYANESAIEYGERLLTLVEDASRGEVLLNLGKVLELTGEWERAETVARDSLRLARKTNSPILKARSETALAEVSRKHGHYEEAEKRLARAARAFRKLEDDAGLGLVLHVSGTVAAQQGQFEEAKTRYDGSLRIRQRLDDKPAMASLYSNLAIVAQYTEDFSNAREANERALQIRNEIGDRWGIGVSHNNIGMIAFFEHDHVEAKKQFEEAIRLCREAGDPWMIALANNNLGNAARELGDHDTARRSYTASLNTYRINDDRWAMAFLFEDMAVLAAKSAAAEAAFELYGAATALREEIHSPRTDQANEEILSQLEGARAEIGEPAARDASERGNSWTLTETIDAGLRFASS